MAKPSVQEMLHEAYSTVRGSEMSKSISNVTLDHLLQEQIDSIRGVGQTSSKLSRLRTIEQNIDAVVQAAKGTP